MNTELNRTISKEEIDWVKAKHDGIHKSVRRMLKDAIEIGQWFNEAADRMGMRLTSHSRRGTRGGNWSLWVRATFPEIHFTTIGRYMRLANGYDYLKEKFSLENGDNMLLDSPTISQALALLAKRDRETKEKEEPNQPLAEFEEPLQILADQLKSYVYEMFRLKYLEDQIKFRIKNAGLGRRQVRQALEWACREHAEIKDVVMDTFLK